MSTACLVLFHRYDHSHRGNLNILYDYFVKQFNIWASAVDHLYVLDSGRMLDQPRINTLNNIAKKLTVLARPASSHWDNMNYAMPLIQEDKLLLIDGDLIFSSLDVVEKIYEDLDRNEIVSITDNSGGIDLFNQFPVLKANHLRDDRRRLCPYLFACQMSTFKKIGGFDFTPLTGSGWTDSMGSITKQLFDLNPSFKELPDDRSSLYYRDNGKHEQVAFLDAPSFEWSKTTQNDYGYYHTRNWATGHYLVETKLLDQKNYQRCVRDMPQQEALRLLGWVYIMAPESYKKEIIKAAKGFGPDRDQFLQYMDTFQDFHRWSSKI